MPRRMECFEDWHGNNEADIQAKKGAEKHGYTATQKNDIQSKVTLAKNVKEHMLKNYIYYTSTRWRGQAH
eukprot:12686975-Heterocapsa_arctica.AAC.1